MEDVLWKAWFFTNFRNPIHDALVTESCEETLSVLKIFLLHCFFLLLHWADGKSKYMGKC